MCHWLKLTSFWWKSQLFGQKSLEDCQIFDILHQILVKKYLKKYRQPKMYQYIDTFFNENVSMCRYKYILKVSDTYTVSDTKGLSILIIYHFPLQMFFSYLIYAIAYQEFPCAFFIGYILYFWTTTF